MKAISYIYAVLNDYISCDDFVNWTFEAIEEGQIVYQSIKTYQKNKGA